MTDKTLVPEAVKVAAKRGFLRTTFQAYAATLTAGTISSAAVAALIDNPDPKLFAATAIAAVVSPPVAGLASWLSITAKGIPADYQPTSGD